jgi:hypothetical protein
MGEMKPDWDHATQPGSIAYRFVVRLHRYEFCRIVAGTERACLGCSRAKAPDSFPAPTGSGATFGRVGIA